MMFSAIQGSSDPEEFSWQVSLGHDQQLKSVDDRHAAVYYPEDGQTAFVIAAKSAHDADGSSVPTSLSVSGVNLITLTIHHRLGNPAAGGTPFAYPVTEGAGWDSGYTTGQVEMPPPEARSDDAAGSSSRRCVVPGLTGRSLSVDRKRLKSAGCSLGKVRGERSGKARVVKQDVAPGTVLGAGARVSVKLDG
jgi:hypothetical protein